MKGYQKVFAVLFLLLLGGMSLVNMESEKGAIAHGIGQLEAPADAAGLQAYTAGIDTVLTENLVGGHVWNELYGGVYLALGKKEENNFTYVKDKNNFLYSGNFWNTSMVEADNLALRLRKLSDYAAQEGAEFLCIMYPTKYNEAWSEGYYGIPYNDMNAFADEVLLYLRRYNVDYLDYREVFGEAGMGMEEIFYQTDHHWTVPTAFYSTGVLMDYLEEHYGDKLDPEGYYQNLDNYIVETHEDIYLGSQGRETGVLYAEELDDYTYIYPKRDGQYLYSWTAPGGEAGQKQGGFLDTLIDKKYLGYEDPYEREMYSSYLNGVNLSDSIVNEENPEGRKLLFIRDSCSSPVAAFLSPMCGQIDCVWPLYADAEKVLEQAGTEGYDYIFVALAVDNFRSQGIPYYGEEVSRELQWEPAAQEASDAPQ